MRRRDFIWQSSAACTIGAAARRARAASPPNILLLLSDDHSYPHLGCYGNAEIRTPSLDALAAAGLRCDRAYVTCPQCVPSRASILTGRAPVAIDMTRFSAPLPLDVPTFPELLRAAGYYTGVAGRTFHLDGAYAGPELGKYADEKQLRTFERRLDYVRQGGRAEYLPQFEAFLDARPADRPFFLQLCSPDPHRPLDANAIPEPHDPAKLTLPAHYPDTPGVRQDFARYYDEISRLDSDVGGALRLLAERGLADQTIVLFMGDNGASQLRGKGTLNEFGIHVPLLVRWPGVVQAGSTSHLISGEDLAPTLLQAAGLEPPAAITGRSFLPLLRGTTYTPRSEVYCERGAHGSGLPTGSAPFDLGRCVVTPTHKLIYNALWQLPYQPVDFGGEAFWKDIQQRAAAGQLNPVLQKLYNSPTRPLFELYDLQADPAELTNLAGQAEHAALERDLKVRLSKWMIDQRDFVPLPVVPPPKKP
ncbi:MAG: sulfatase [Fimbriimonadaceae bacterium]|nr:sulfatase [Fimbriimonadaceae bacterium]